MKVTLAGLFAAAISLFLLGCESSEKEDPVGAHLPNWVGKNVEVQFRRDALGAAAALPVSPETGQINGASTSFYGKLIKVEGSSVVIEVNGSLKWIPRDVILYVGLRQ